MTISYMGGGGRRSVGRLMTSKCMLINLNYSVHQALLSYSSSPQTQTKQEDNNGLSTPHSPVVTAPGYCSKENKNT